MSEEEIDATFMFRYLLVFTAALESFAHGEGGIVFRSRPHPHSFLQYVAEGFINGEVNTVNACIFLTV